MTNKYHMRKSRAAKQTETGTGCHRYSTVCAPVLFLLQTYPGSHCHNRLEHIGSNNEDTDIAAIRIICTAICHILALLPLDQMDDYTLNYHE